MPRRDCRASFHGGDGEDEVGIVSPREACWGSWVGGIEIGISKIPDWFHEAAP